jgi:plasmid stability protein
VAKGNAERQVATKLPPDLIDRLDERAARNLRDRAHEMRAILEAALRGDGP